jgi:hypothetical protein
MLGRILSVTALGLAVAAAGAPAIAHHGWSGYDDSRVLTLTGTIRESGPSRMERRGLPAALLAAGKTATVVGYPHRTEPEEMRAERITVEGKTIELR